MRMELKLKILTLNCWGIPVISRNRKDRFTAIAAELSNGTYDFVVLQEVWSLSDYNFVATKSKTALPYSHFFHSGVIGAGICIFSKAPIIDAIFQSWTLNGYAHRIQHGDWFGGKGVGMCKVLHHGLKINIYTAHLHAEYHRPNDEYLSHRICQAVEFSQFVKLTGETSDLNIVAGDFNAEPDDLTFRIVRFNANLLDSFAQIAKKEKNGMGATNEHPANSYTPKSALKNCPNGKRIDYILYNYNSGTDVRCLECQTLLDKCPNQSFSISDHEAVVATLHAIKSSSNVPMELPLQAQKDVFEEAECILGNSVKSLNGDRLFYFIGATLLFCVLFGTVHVETQLPFGFQTILVFLRIVLSVLIAFCIFMGSIWNRIEYNGIVGVQKVLNILLRNLNEMDFALDPPRL